MSNPEQQNQAIRLAEINAYAIHELLTPNIQERVRLMCEYLNQQNPDIIFFSELWQASLLDYVAQAMPNYSLWAPSTILDKVIGFHQMGSAFLVRDHGPLSVIDEPVFEAFPMTGGHFLDERLARKGHMHAVLEHNGQRLVVRMAHLHAYSNEHNVAIPEAQAQIMLDQAMGDKEDFILIGGDLNLPLPVLKRLIKKNGERLKTLGWNVLWSGDETPTIVQGNPLQQRGVNAMRGVRPAKIDFCFMLARSGSKVNINTLVGHGIYFSDHLPLLEEIQLSPRYDTLFGISPSLMDAEI